MIREHVIETLEWDVAFRSEEEALDWQSRLVELVRGPAVDAIASVFDELCAPGQVLVLDRLELDLGALAREDLQTQLPARLCVCLREALMHELGASRAGASDAAQLVTPEAGDAQTLKHYLARGFLPWRAGARGSNRLEEAARHMTREPGPDLAEWLRTAPQHAGDRLRRLLAGEIRQLRALLEAVLLSDMALDARARQAWSQLVRWDGEWLIAHVRRRGQVAQVRHRMARIFSQEMLLELVALLVPTEVDFVQDVVGQGALLARAQESALSAGELRPRLWEFTLTYLLVERGSDFNRRSYVGSILQQAARQEGMDYAHLLHAMSHALRGVAAPTGLQRQMLQLLGDLARDEDERMPQRASDEAASLQLIALYDGDGPAGDAADRRRQLRARLRLERALLVDTAWNGSLRHAWSQLVRWDAQWVVEQARHHGQEPRVRRRMARIFPRQTLLELVELLVPAEHAFVHEVVGQPTLFAHARRQAAPADDLQPRLWEFTLTYLLVERGSDFNRRSYMGSLLRQTALHDGLDYGDLLGAMSRALREAPAPSPLQRQMLQLLENLTEAQGPARPGAAAASRSRSTPGCAKWIQHELPELRFRWQAALATGDLRDAAVHAAWHQLARHDTEWLLEQTRTRAQSEPLRRQMAHALPELALLDLVALVAPRERDFIEAALRQAALIRAPGVSHTARQRLRPQLWEFTLTYLLVERGTEFNRRSYIGSLLRQMAGRDGVGIGELLEALAASLRCLPVAGDLQRQMLRLTLELLGQHDAAHAAQPARAQQAARFAQALQGVGSLSRAAAAQLVRDAHDLLAHPDSSLRAAMEGQLRSADTVARLLALLPVRLLTRMVWALRREHHHALQRGADLIVDAIIAGGTQAPRGRLQALKWQYVFRYLFVEGREFSLQDFARRFTDWLAGELRVGQPGPWRACVARHAILDKRGGAGQAIRRAVAQSLSASARAPSKPTQRPLPTKPALPAEEPALGEPIYIANAGLVLCEPYLPRLFAMAGLTDGAAFRDAACAAMAVHLMQFAATGAQESPEHQLVLNKLLCGLAIEAPLACEATLAQAQAGIVDSMLKGMLAHWKALGATTVEGLRETFLQRAGRLVRHEEHWELLVDAGPFDMLLDQLPWGFSMLKYPWMERRIHVQWR